MTIPRGDSSLPANKFNCCYCKREGELYLQHLINVCFLRSDSDVGRDRQTLSNDHDHWRMIVIGENGVLIAAVFFNSTFPAPIDECG